MPTLHLVRGARVAVPTAALLVLAICPAPPAGAALTADDPQAVAAYAVARQHWKAEPCDGAVRIRWTRLERGLNALARWWARSLDAPETYYACRIDLNRVEDWDWPKLCTVVVHEVGHLLGLPHSADPDDVMHETYGAPLERCARRRPPPCRRRDGSRPGRSEKRALCPATRLRHVTGDDPRSGGAVAWEDAPAGR
jgi:hypothetical protein